jgi:tRNA pseudouridine38-40 synthase
MPNYLVILTFDGSDFHGWQTQPELRTVQETCEQAVATLFEPGINVTAAGRTDAGVHAIGMPANFKTIKMREPHIVKRALNGLLARDVRVTDCRIVPDDFSARFKARSRAYRYLIETALVADPLTRRYAWQAPVELHLESMQDALADLVGEHDFSSFRASDCASISPVRRMLSARMTELGDGKLELFFEATGFLKHMVRSIVGTLVEIGKGDRPPEDMRELLAHPDRSRVGRTAPPQGLFFIYARYPESS